MMVDGLQREGKKTPVSFNEQERGPAAAKTKQEAPWI